MKDYIVPYTIGQNTGWWGGIDIYNHNSEESAVTIRIFRHVNGVRSREIPVTIEKFGHHILLPGDISQGLEPSDSFKEKNRGRATIIVRGPDGLMITPFMGCTDKDNRTTGFGILPVYEDTNLKN